jgi:3'(2'), 5'-bisphosphate nucleotidase
MTGRSPSRSQARQVSELQELLPRIVAVAEKAGRAVMNIYSGGKVWGTYKADHSPITRADTVSHEIIVAELQNLTPDLPVLSEETKAVPYSDRARWDEFWLIDPLDGTKEFIKQNGEFTINIAFVEKDDPVLGVVHAPASDTTYFGGRGLGAFKRGPSEDILPITVSNCLVVRTKVMACQSFWKRWVLLRQRTWAVP